MKKFKGHKEFVNAVDVCYKAPQLFCSGSDDKTAKVEIATSPFFFIHLVIFKLSFFLLDTFKLWDRRKKNEAASFESPYQILSIAFNETADQIFSAGIDNEIKVWDIRKNGLLYTMKGHKDCPTGLRLSPDGCFLASNAMDNTSN